MATDRTSGVRTFLIADIRGYSRYTEEGGDEAAAALSKKFATIVNDDVEAHGGGLVELRGDEALVVFTSARAAIRAAVDLPVRGVRRRRRARSSCSFSPSRRREGRAAA